MKLAQMSRDGVTRLCLFEGDHVYDLQATANAAGVSIRFDMREAINRMDDLHSLLREARPYLVPFNMDGARFENLLTPPGKILCVGANYRKHIEESKMSVPTSPVLFAKFANAFAAHRQDIEIPAVTQKADYECELVLIVGKRGKNIPRARALSHLFGYTCGNDLSARDLQTVSTQWLIGKSPDHFAPVGPYAVLAGELNPNNLNIQTRVNGELRQSANTNDMLFDCAEIIRYASAIMTLEPGDLIFTGTPHGVAMGYPEGQQPWLKPGDVIEVEIEGIGTLENRMV